MALEGSAGGFDFSLLGEFFTVEEMGRLARLEQSRRVLSENGTSVLRSSVETLAREKERRAAKDAPPLDSVQLNNEAKRKKKNNQG